MLEVLAVGRRTTKKLQPGEQLALIRFDERDVWKKARDVAGLSRDDVASRASLKAAKTIKGLETGFASESPTKRNVAKALGLEVEQIERFGLLLRRASEFFHGGPLPDPKVGDTSPNSAIEEVQGMESWRELFKNTVGGMVNNPDEAQRVKDKVMEWLVEWRGTPAPLPEENTR